MGLQSALTTALTGLRAAEAQIDIVGNNLANSQTVGFKESDVRFSTQFVRSLGLGSAPSGNSGGTNPRQVGLGVQVSEITPNFTQGTIEGSGLSSDLALQGDGFFIVDGGNGEQQFTRNGIFNINSENQLVTITGQRLLGHAVDDNFQLITTQLSALTIPVGSAAVAQPTQNVFLEGTFSPTGAIADTAEVVQSGILGDGSVPRPDTSATVVTIAATPDASGSTATEANVGGGTLAAGDYEYKFKFADALGTESVSSVVLNETVNPGNNAINLANLPASPITQVPTPDYPLVNIYRRDASVPGSQFQFLTQVAEGTAAVTDDGNTALGTIIDETTINGNFSYLVTFFKAGEEESRPSEMLGPNNVTNGRIQLRDLPIPPVPGPGDTFPAYDKVRIYRNIATDPSSYFLVDKIDPGQNYKDGKTDVEISANQA
ncbi:MAG: flagellar hook-basal body complex protein, partial [Planctomycetes bacterium]|nr:flagellar hook-basal body complex protein [Planctomycetota bacterium]